MTDYHIEIYCSVLQHNGIQSVNVNYQIFFRYPDLIYKIDQLGYFRIIFHYGYCHQTGYPCHYNCEFPLISHLQQILKALEADCATSKTYEMDIYKENLRFDTLLPLIAPE